MKTGKTKQTGGMQSSPVQSKAKNQGNEGSILQAYKNGTAQLADMEEDPLQGKFDTTQLAAEEDEELPV